MKQFLLAAIFACAPVAAAALSCTPHSVEAAFLEAQASEKPFLIVRGHMTFDARKLPKVDYQNQHATPDVTRIDAKLTGASLSGAGFVTPYEGDIILSVECFGPWCAGAQDGVEVLAFVDVGAQEHVVSTNPCGGYLFGTPTPKMIRAVQSCFAGKTCKPLR